MIASERCFGGSVVFTRYSTTAGRQCTRTPPKMALDTWQRPIFCKIHLVVPPPPCFFYSLRRHFLFSLDTNKMLLAGCRRVLRSSASIRCRRREGKRGTLEVDARGRLRARRWLSTSSTAEDGAAMAVEPQHIRNIAIIAHVGKSSAAHLGWLLRVVAREIEGGRPRSASNCCGFRAKWSGCSLLAESAFQSSLLPTPACQS